MDLTVFGSHFFWIFTWCQQRIWHFLVLWQPFFGLFWLSSRLHMSSSCLHISFLVLNSNSKTKKKNLTWQFHSKKNSPEKTLLEKKLHSKKFHLKTSSRIHRLTFSEYIPQLHLQLHPSTDGPRFFNPKILKQIQDFQILR